MDPNKIVLVLVLNDQGGMDWFPGPAGPTANPANTVLALEIQKQAILNQIVRPQQPINQITTSGDLALLEKLRRRQQGA